MDTRVRALGQKYMGLYDNAFHDASLKEDGGHDVLVDNFLNAQCTVPPC